MKRIIILAVLFILLLPGVVFAQEGGSVIEGRVVNQTEGGGSVVGLDVSLLALVDGDIMETQTGTTNEEGEFYFAGVSGEHEYLILVNFMEIDYYYPLDFAGDETKISIEIPVCDTTTGSQVIRAVLYHIIVRVEDEFISLTEVFWLVNDSGRTYVGGEDTKFADIQGTLVFTLPEGVTGFQVPEETVEDYVLVDNNTVVNTLVFPPGERQVVYSYKLVKPGSGDLIIPLNIDYPSDSLDVMVQGEGIEVASAVLLPAEPVETDTGQRFIHFRGENLNRGEIVDVRLSIPSAGIDFVPVIITVVVIALILALAIYYLRSRILHNRLSDDGD